MKPSFLDYFLSQQERALYQQYAHLLVANFPIFIVANVLIYCLATLLFFNAIPWAWHLGLGIFWLFFAFFTLLCISTASRQMQKSAKNSAIWTTCIGTPISLYWAVYFHILSRAHDADLTQQFIMLQSTITFIGIATVGRFYRISISILIIDLFYFVGSLAFWPLDEAKAIILQFLLMILAELIFLRTLNQQVDNLFKIKYEHSDLLDVLQQKNKALEQANQSQSRYLSAASHDLRQPLHALALLTNDAQRKNTAPEISTTLHKMEQAIDSLSQSFNAMLNLSRLDAGVVKPQFKRFPIQRLLQRLALEYSDVAEQKSLTLTIRPSKLWLLSDEDMLYSILSNFVSNALRYTQTGGILVGVRIHNKDDIKLMVYDTGTGVPAEKAQQIFQEYQRLEEAQQRVKGGVGLGLAISERTAKLLGNQLWVKSTLGRGSTFGIILTPTRSQFEEAKTPIALDDLLTHRRVAIFDDDEVALESLSELLSSWGMEVSIVLSSAMYHELMQEEEHFDFIISDYHLGLTHETGLDILKMARKDSPTQPICILLTGDTRTELAQETQAAGVNIWYKPIRPARLRAYLNGLAHAFRTQK
ncbi:MAG: ATP-binding protein [Formosimonas sp.]